MNLFESRLGSRFFGTSKATSALAASRPDNGLPNRRIDLRAIGSFDADERMVVGPADAIPVERI
jgi:hypothetical protein